MVISGGVVAASGTPAQLTAAAGQPRLRVTLTEARPAQLAGVQAALGPGALLGFVSNVFVDRPGCGRSPTGT